MLRESLHLLVPSKGLVTSGILVMVVVVWFVVSPSEQRSANPWNSNYDASLNNSGPKLRRVTKIEFERAYKDRDGVMHQREDMKALDAEKYK